MGLALLLPSVAAAQEGRRTGSVVEASGVGIAGASIVVRSTQGAVLHVGTSATDGTFSLDGLPAGSYALEVSARDFQPRRLSLDLVSGEASPLTIVLGLGPFQSDVTVTARRGGIADIDHAAPIVTVRDAADFRRRPLVTIGDALDGAAGVMLQQTTPGQSSPFLRGLTGYHVLALIDGVRFNNATFRSGPNQYLAFAEPSQVQRIETMLGPASAQYGSDALGGTIQLLTPNAATGVGRTVTGDVTLSGASANTSGGADAGVMISGRRVSWLVGGARRQVNDLRAGGGRDSHHVLRRLFGLSDAQIREIGGTRQRDTGFTHTGIHAKASARLGDGRNLSVWYQGSTVDGVRVHKDRWGGLGRLRSDVEPQSLRFFYGRYERQQVGPFDGISATFSLNSQRDGSVRQGLREVDPITRDTNRVDALGYTVQATTRAGSRHAMVLGGEIYDEHVDARREETNPVTGSAVLRRPLYPNGSRYTTTGLFVRDAIDLVRGAGGAALRADVSGRFTHVRLRSFADRNTDAAGHSLGVLDSTQSHHDWTFNAGLTWQAREGVVLHGLVGRGFRAPNLNDLGALGLNDLGFEVPANTTLDGGALIGTSDGETAVSSGRRVTSLTAERLVNVEGGAAVRWRRVAVRAHVFNAVLDDPIVRRTLLFPIDGVPSTIAGLAVRPVAATAAQREQGVTPVATAVDPRAVKAFVNDGRARYRGVDALVGVELRQRWSLEGTYSYLVGHDLAPTRPVRRLPPQQAALALRYRPGGRAPWVEVRARLSGAQTALSGGDITDERIGAARRRSDITDFFRGGLIRPYLLAGGDGRLGTADDVFAPTGETAAQIGDRVLPIGATINGVLVADDGTRVPLYLETPGHAAVDLHAGAALSARLRLNVAVTNVLDRSYRVHGSGVDALGAGGYAGLSLSF